MEVCWSNGLLLLPLTTVGTNIQIALVLFLHQWWQDDGTNQKSFPSFPVNPEVPNQSATRQYQYISGLALDNSSLLVILRHHPFRQNSELHLTDWRVSDAPSIHCSYFAVKEEIANLHILTAAHLLYWPLWQLCTVQQWVGVLLILMLVATPLWLANSKIRLKYSFPPLPTTLLQELACEYQGSLQSKLPGVLETKLILETLARTVREYGSVQCTLHDNKFICGLLD